MRATIACMKQLEYDLTRNKKTEPGTCNLTTWEYKNCYKITPKNKSCLRKCYC